VEDWIYENNRLFRRWSPGNEELVWDGQTLQRTFFESQDVFTYNGRTIRWAYGDIRSEFIIQGNIVKRVQSSGRDESWEINGDLPIPIIMMVVFGLTMR
jgi:hypothetical protein